MVSIAVIVYFTEYKQGKCYVKRRSQMKSAQKQHIHWRDLDLVVTDPIGNGKPSSYLSLLTLDLSLILLFNVRKAL